MRETWVWSLGQEDPLEKEMAPHSGILAWRIPWLEEPGGLQSTGLQRVGHNWASSLSLFTLSKYLVYIINAFVSDFHSTQQHIAHKSFGDMKIRRMCLKKLGDLLNQCYLKTWSADRPSELLSWEKCPWCGRKWRNTGWGQHSLKRMATFPLNSSVFAHFLTSSNLRIL